ncbi:SAM-dependent methyltransferase [Virgibacillus dokdonensis]|uniref:site-specific DNA-methyltransferase (adenine-specific) n=1 Tax=Virgibacillus dokdonensis TaxID=302167 RepID=A0A3E0WKI4_9BACI|nr:BREX-1 system adenine-specific DNA-methyltransferase PglX [Virgibacillus dokdonensis]RFA32733.1 SAM-dependent methyltransferase [Virgibacillus dokdonensis]
MNKSALRSFATNARRELLNKVKSKAMKIGITEEKIKKADVESSDAIFIDGRQLTSKENTQREKLINRIKQKGFNQVMEEVAYTWFNRFTALRFMEVNEYLPSNVRVLSSANPEDPIPDIIKEAMSLDFDIDKEWVYERKVKNENDKLFQYLIIKQCNDLYEYLPFMFEKIDNFTEILFPEGLLSKDSFLRQMTDIDSITEEDWSNVEIIGWLYQYYIAEEKDRVIKAKKKYKTEEIPFATQLFTPDWIVQYMVQNSLGRYWVENHPEDRGLINDWEFYLEKSNPEEDFKEKLEPYLNRQLKVEEIKCFDPAMGSGHILVYMFDVLYEIYSRSGYLERDIPKLIIENNLYGLDIDDRAYQLACFSVVMKAMQYNNRFLRSIKRHGIKLNLVSIQETNDINEEDIYYLVGKQPGEEFERVKGLFKKFINAKTYGSLIRFDKFDTIYLRNRLKVILDNPAKDIFEETARNKILNILNPLIKQIDILSMQYDILITNPPYIGSKYMNADLKEFVNENYKDSKSDLFVAFMDIAKDYVVKSGHIGMITPYVWMFINTYSNLRSHLILNNTISSLIQLEYNAFEVATVPVCTFTMRNYKADIPGEYIRLADFKGSSNQPIKVLEAIENPQVYYRYTTYMSSFLNIPNKPIAYWINKRVSSIFKVHHPLSQIATTRIGLVTGDSKRFLRYWYEVDMSNISFSSKNNKQALESGEKWFPYQKGGPFRRWYGNLDYVVNWEKDGYEMKFENSVGDRVKSHNYNGEFAFKEGITWSDITTGKFAGRDVDVGFMFDSSGPMMFVDDNKYKYYMLAYCNSKVFQLLIELTSQGFHYNSGTVANVPFITPNTEQLNNVTAISKDSISIAKRDWDYFENSWDFKIHPFLDAQIRKDSIKATYNEWEKVTERNKTNLKDNEEELNLIFSQLYGLEKDTTKSVDEADITIYQANLNKDIRSFISYAVGCMFGRYSLDQDGLFYAGGIFDNSKNQTFKADEDNILPILSGSYFEDDIVSRFVDFVKITFGEETSAENLDFIAETLGKKKNETAKETIRRYFLNDFFKDHVQTYKKRPIYWLFSSGKHKAFNCLIYMHRYDSTTLGRIRTDYLHELQTRMDAEKESLMNIIDGDATSKEITKAKKELTSLEKKIEELKEYDEVLHHMADQQIEIDLDDGVEVNYEKFKGLLAKK